MVFTRSRARQQALDEVQSACNDTETPQSSQPVVQRRATKSAKRIAVVAISPVTTPTKRPPPTSRTENQTTAAEDTIEELALRALRTMKAKLGMTSPEIEPQSEEESQPNVMTLEPDSDSEKPPGSGKSRRPDVLATFLKPSMKETLYFSYSRKKGILRTPGKASTTWGDNQEDELMKKSVITPDFEKKEAAPPMYVSKYARARARKVSQYLTFSHYTSFTKSWTVSVMY